MLVGHGVAEVALLPFLGGVFGEDAAVDRVSFTGLLIPPDGTALEGLGDSAVDLELVAGGVAEPPVFPAVCGPVGLDGALGGVCSGGR